VKYHIHRLNGTAQLLGINEFITIAQRLEERLPALFLRQNLSTF
jgi:two-component system sensor histidine kinase EvgS